MVKENLKETVASVLSIVSLELISIIVCRRALYSPTVNIFDVTVNI